MLEQYHLEEFRAWKRQQGERLCYAHVPFCGQMFVAGAAEEKQVPSAYLEVTRKLQRDLQLRSCRIALLRPARRASV
jgi:hypothetical protein